MSGIGVTAGGAGLRRPGGSRWTAVRAVAGALVAGLAFAVAMMCSILAGCSASGRHMSVTTDKPNVRRPMRPSRESEPRPIIPAVSEKERLERGDVARVVTQAAMERLGPLQRRGRHRCGCGRHP